MTAGVQPFLDRSLRHLVVRIVNEYVSLALIFEHPALGSNVLVKRMLIPVKVVRRNIEYHRDLRPERVDKIQLETAHLQDRERSRGKRVGRLRERGADVSCHDRFLRRVFRDPAEKRRRRRFAVRPGDGHNGAWQNQLATSISLTTFNPCWRASRTIGASDGTPGLTTRTSDSRTRPVFAPNSYGIPRLSSSAFGCRHPLGGRLVAEKHRRAVRAAAGPPPPTRFSLRRER